MYKLNLFFKAFAYVISFGLFFITISNLVQDYISESTGTTTVIVQSEKSQLPAFTICTQKAYKTDVIQSIHLTLEDFDAATYALEDIFHNKTIKNLSKFNFTSASLCLPYEKKRFFCNFAKIESIEITVTSWQFYFYYHHYYYY